jgi:RNA polymerase sigma-70 factor, ECF subfamily
MNELLHSADFLAFKEGRPNGLGAIYKLYSSQIRYFSEKFTRNKQDAEDVTMQVFIVLFEKRQRFSSEKDIPAFLYFTARYKCLDLHRSVKSKKTVDIDCPDDEYRLAFDDYKTQNEIIESIVLKQVFTAVADLPNQCREVFRLTFFEDLPNTEIAKQLCIAPATVRSHMRRAVELLRIRLIDNPDALAFLLIITLLENGSAV